MKSLLQKIILCFVLSLTVITHGYATAYFVNSINGNDQNLGTNVGAPWKSLNPIQAKTFLPGDIINFACGSVWTKASYEYVLLIDDNGTADQPIVFQAYGEGDKPTFSNNGTWNKGIKITASHVVIDSLMFTNTGYAGIEIAPGADHNVVRNCEMTSCGIGVHIQGSFNLLTKNYIHDMVMVVNDPKTVNPDNDFGATAFLLDNANSNEISYNKAVTCKAPSFDYGNDGGFVEIWTSASNNTIHHNWVENTEGFMEAGGSNSSQMVENNVVSYNVSYNNSGFICLHTGGGGFDVTVVNMRIENNTIVSTVGGYRIIGCIGASASANVLSLKNNIIYSSIRIADFANFIHTNNFYYITTSAGVGYTLGVGEKIVNPRFMDLAGKDFRLKSISPAINAGIDLKYDKDFNGITVPFGKAPDLGAYEYENPTAIGDVLFNETEEFFSIFPNPTDQRVNFVFSATQGQKVGIRIVNIQGQTIMDYSHSARSNGKNLVLMDLKTSAGLYIAKLIKGTEVASRKFLIQ